MRITLVRPPFIDVHYGPPIGFAFLSARLKQYNHEVTIIDFNIDLHRRYADYSMYTRDFVVLPEHAVVQYAYTSIDEYCQCVKESSPDIVGFYLSYPTIEFGVAMARILSQEVRCIAGGPQATYNEDDLLALGCFDTIVSGYGEEAVLEALKKTGIISVPLDTRSEYIPDYSDISLNDYEGRFSVVTTRGCPNQCTFCTQHLKYFYHSIDSVLSQLTSIAGIKKLMFNDSNINVNAKRTIQLFQAINDSGLRYPAHIFGMQVVKGYKEYIPLLAETGVAEVRLGIESGSLRERTSMCKPQFINDMVINMVKMLTDNRIITWCQFIFCYPDQTDEDREATLALMKEINEVCDIRYVRHFWFKFVIHHGTERYFRKTYNVEAKTPREWKNDLYSFSIIENLREKYKKYLPVNAAIYL